MDYEYYSVEPYNQLDPQRNPREYQEILALFSPAYQEATRKIEAFFRPAVKVKPVGVMFPLEARPFEDTALIHCKTPSDLEATLLRR